MGYQLGVFYFAAFIAHAIFLSGTALVVAHFRVHVIEVKLGLGPKVFSRGKFALTPLPLGGYVRMLDAREDGESVKSEHTYDQQGRLTRVLIALSGPIALLLAAVALRGNTGWESFLHGFEQILSGAFAPASRGAELAEGYLRVVEKMGFVAALGVLLSKWAALHLLPIPIIGGGMALVELLSPSASTREKIHHIGLFVLVALMASWLYAFAVAAP